MTLILVKTKNYITDDLINTLLNNPQPTEFLKPVLSESFIQTINTENTSIIHIETSPYHFSPLLEEIKYIAKTYHPDIYHDLINKNTTLTIYAYTEGDDFQNRANKIFY